MDLGGLRVVLCLRWGELASYDTNPEHPGLWERLSRMCFPSWRANPAGSSAEPSWSAGVWPGCGIEGIGLSFSIGMSKNCWWPQVCFGAPGWEPGREGVQAHFSRKWSKQAKCSHG